MKSLAKILITGIGITTLFYALPWPQRAGLAAVIALACAWRLSEP